MYTIQELKEKEEKNLKKIDDIKRRLSDLNSQKDLSEDELLQTERLQNDLDWATCMDEVLYAKIEIFNIKSDDQDSLLFHKFDLELKILEEIDKLQGEIDKIDFKLDNSNGISSFGFKQLLSERYAKDLKILELREMYKKVKEERQDILSNSVPVFGRDRNDSKREKVSKSDEYPEFLDVLDMINSGDEDFNILMKSYHDEIKQLNDEIDKNKSNALRAKNSGETGVFNALERNRRDLYKSKADFYKKINRLNEAYIAEINRIKAEPKDGDGSKLSDDEKKKLKMLQGRSWELTKLGLGENSNNKRHRVNENIPSLDEVLKAQNRKKGKEAKSAGFGEPKSRTGGHEAHNRRVINRRRDLNNREKKIRERMAKILRIPVSDNIEDEYEHDIRFQLDDYEVDEIQELREELKKIKNIKQYNKGKEGEVGKENSNDTLSSKSKEKEKGSFLKGNKEQKSEKKGEKKTSTTSVGPLRGLVLQIIKILRKVFKNDNLFAGIEVGLIGSGVHVSTLDEGKVEKAKKEAQQAKREQTKKAKAKSRTIKFKKGKKQLEADIGKFKKSIKNKAKGIIPKIGEAKNKFANVFESFKHEYTAEQKNLLWIKNKADNYKKGDKSSKILHYVVEKQREKIENDLNTSFLEDIMQDEGIAPFFSNDYDTILYSRTLCKILDLAEKYKIDTEDKPIEEIWDTIVAKYNENRAAKKAREQQAKKAREQQAKKTGSETRDFASRHEDEEQL